MDNTNSSNCSNNTCSMLIKEDVISFNIAKLACEAGFNLPTQKFWLTNQGQIDSKLNSVANEMLMKDWNHNYIGNTRYSAPTPALLMKWLEIEYAIFIDTDTMTSVNEILGFNVLIKSWKFFPIIIGNEKDKYIAIDKALYRALKLVIKEKNEQKIKSSK